MKKTHLLLTSYLFWFSILMSQNNLSGIYSSESGLSLRIEKDSFKLIVPNPTQNGLYSEIMAEGTIKQIEKSFIELNSVNGAYSNVLKNINITQDEKMLSNDSITIKFLIPYKYGKLKIVLFTNLFKEFKFDYSINNQCINIPDNVKIISFSIRPDYIMPHTSEGLYYGLAEFNSIEYEIKKKMNYIEIEIPAIDDSFFQKYYLKNDYARILKNSIIWKGIIFNKVEQKV